MKKNIKRRTLAVLLCALILVGMIPVCGAEADYIRIQAGNVTVDKNVDYATDGYYEVAVPIEITENSGVLSVRIEVSHPESIELVGWENGDVFAESANKTPSIANNAAENGIVVYYGNEMSVSNVTKTGTLITLVYNVPEDIESGDLDITLKLKDIYKEDGNRVTLPEKINNSCELVAGAISVIETEGSVKSGDVNGDGTVDRKDLTRLAQYFARWTVEIDESAADTNGDGTVDRKDLTRLAQYFARWDVELGK